IDEAGSIFWNGEAIHRDALPMRLEAARAGNPELHLRADRGTRYEKVAEVMAAAQAAGIVKIAFVTEPAAR
ncbi:MAG TPA: biopolymer transporter ExbD, partial [Rhodocyclaceae bacterium]|nr:biopolymer transporter ExbD [Rhodocyclaceae bacterium]